MNERNLGSESEFLTLEQTLDRFPPQTQTFEHKTKDGTDIISAEVSRDEAGQIVYIVPESVKYVQGGPLPEPTQNNP